MCRKIWKADRVSESRNGIADYEAAVAVSGCCRSLLPCGAVAFPDCWEFSFSLPDLIPFAEVIRLRSREIGGVYRGFLGRLLSVAAAMMDAEDYMVPPEHLCLAPDSVFFYKGAAGLILLPGGSAADSFLLLARFGQTVDSRIPGDRLTDLISNAAENGACSPGDFYHVFSGEMHRIST